jgi:diaminohydroxyphosphoribosylaminopyrimidine deaminase/5-amino-6-(5-phosphoribosylamino)uracil reductase
MIPGDAPPLTDEEYMRLALKLARRGLGWTAPNPMVGAVLVKDNHIIGQGYHHKYGGNHAEVNALQDASADPAGATLYVTLEPCCHYGKTPPCVDAIIANKIKRVVIGTLDPNPRVAGRSVKILSEHGIDTRTGVLEKECRELNEAHYKLMTTGMPLVTLKFAQTLDGRIATASGDSRWVSSKEFRKRAHQLRAINDAVLVGIETVLADNPQLTVRLVRGRNPVRVILDSRLRMSLDAEIVKMRKAAPVIIATTTQAGREKGSRLRGLGIEVTEIQSDESGEIDLKSLLQTLGERNISSLLVEGGAKVITSFLRQKLADKVVVAIAPKILGKGIDVVGELNISRMSQALTLDFERVSRAGGDVVIEARVNYTAD